MITEINLASRKGYTEMDICENNKDWFRIDI